MSIHGIRKCRSPVATVARPGMFLALLITIWGTPYRSQASITNVILELNGTSSQWVLPAKVQMQIDSPNGLTFQEWLGQYGFDEKGGPVFSSTVDRDATFHHGARVIGFPLPLASSRPKTYFPDDNSSFVALKQNAQGWCRKWMCISINARASGSPPLNWYYQIRYFSGDPFSNQPPSMEIGRVPNGGNYLKDEDLPPDSPLRFEQSGLEVRKVELIQSIQDWSNSIPLIQNKKTYVRLHFYNKTTNDVQVNNVSLQCFYNDGGAWKPWSSLLPADKPNLTVKANTAVTGQMSRTDWNDSLNFKLEYPMTTKPLMVQLKGAGLDCEHPTFVEFEKVDDLSWNFVLCGYFVASREDPNTYFYVVPDEQDTRILLRKLRAMYPLPDNEEVLKQPRYQRLDIPRNPVDCLLPKCFLESSWSSIHSRIAKLNGCDSSGTEIWYGFVSQDYALDSFWDNDPRPTGGQAKSIGNCIAAGFINSGALTTDILAHEVGHLLGRPHTTIGGYRGSCREVASIIPFFPSEIFPYYYTGPEGLNWPFLGPLKDGAFPPDLNADDLITALDSSGRVPKLLRLNYAAEVMSYIDICSNRTPEKWLSKQNYLRVLDEIKRRKSTESLSTETMLAEATSPATQPALILAGVVDLLDTNSYILPIESASLSPPLPTYPPGEYAIRLLAAGGAQLWETTFELALPPIEYPETNQTGASFGVLVPAIAGTAEVQLLRQGQVIARRSASAHAPVVQVLSPNGGETLGDEMLTLQWTANDIDGDELTYRLEFSYDAGYTWDVVTSGWPTNSITVPRSSTFGSTQALWRVIATDGFHSHSDTSDNTFTILNNGPEVIIDLPEENASFSADQSFLLRAIVYDPEENFVAESNIVWSSSMDGRLGVGDELLVPGNRLSVGEHTISAVATDGTGMNQTSVVHITITVRCTYSLGATNRLVPAAGETFTVTVSAPPGCLWAVSNGVPWIEVLSGGGGTRGNGVVTCRVPSNTNATPRSGSLLIARLAFTVNQAAALLPSGYPTSWVHRSTIMVSNSTDSATRMTRDAAGNIIVVGFTDDGVTARDILTIKYSGVDGALLWQRRYNGPRNQSESPTGVAVDGSGNVVITGNSEGDYYTAMYAAADGAIIWEWRYNGPASMQDDAAGICVDPGGNVIVTGHSDNSQFNKDIHTIKYAAADGAVLWERRYNSPANRSDLAAAVAVDSAGDVIVAGTSDNSDYYTTKLAGATGTLIWERRYNGPANSSDTLVAMAVEPNGNVAVTGASFNGANYDYYTAKYAGSDGSLLWERQYNGPANSGDNPKAVAIDASGNVFVTGSSGNANLDDDYYTAKYAAADGALLWESRYNGPVGRFDVANALAVDQNGNVAVTGSSLTGSGNYDAYTIKYSASGAWLMSRYYAGPGSSYDAGNAVIAENDGTVVVAGVSNDDVFTVRYSTNGVPIWDRRYNGLKRTGGGPAGIAIDRIGNVIVGGTTESGTDFYTAKFSPDGRLIWEKFYNGPFNSYDRLRALAVDQNGDVIVAGSVYVGESDQDFYTAKYRGSDGSLLWEARSLGDILNWNEPSFAVVTDHTDSVIATAALSHYETPTRHYDFDTTKFKSDGTRVWWQIYYGPANHDDHPVAVAVDSSDNVLVTGRSFNDFFTVKHGSVDGALIWERRYNGPANRFDAPSAVAVDKDGNAVVTGTSHNGTNTDFYTAKYARTDGVVLWERRYNGPANHDDVGTSVAVDGSGHVVVTGTSNNGTNDDFYTARYASADGTLLWERRYNGPANWNDTARAVALDDNGNVVVTGTSHNGTNDDFYTVKYAVYGGGTLWERSYNGPDNFNDGVVGLAVGPEGMVAVTGSSETRSAAGILRTIATIVYREDLPPLRIEYSAGGIHLRFKGFPGRSYQIQRSSSVTGPWSTVANPTVPLEGTVEVSDVPAVVGGAFYRVRLP